MQDVYQFIAKDIEPPFMLSLPHPYLQLPLSDVCDRPAKLYSNHLFVVETCVDNACLELDRLHDNSSQKDSVHTTKEKDRDFS